MSISRTFLLVAAIAGLTASILSLALSPTPGWVLIIFMIAAWSFLFTFVTVCMVPLPGPPSIPFTAALFFFASGAFGKFLVSLDVYLLDPHTPCFGFLRNSVISSAALGMGALLLLVESIVHTLPLINLVVFATIIVAVAALLIGSVLAYKGSVIGGTIGNIVGFATLLLSAIFNLF